MWAKGGWGRRTAELPDKCLSCAETDNEWNWMSLQFLGPPPDKIRNNTRGLGLSKPEDEYLHTDKASIWKQRFYWSKYSHKTPFLIMKLKKQTKETDSGSSSHVHRRRMEVPCWSIWSRRLGQPRFPHFVADRRSLLFRQKLSEPERLQNQSRDSFQFLTWH